MNTLAGWYPGDAVALAALDALWIVTALVTVSWLAAEIFARRRAALRHALWLFALFGVMASPLLACVGRQLPWRVAVAAAPPPPADLAERGTPSELASQPLPSGPNPAVATPEPRPAPGVLNSPVASTPASQPLAPVAQPLAPAAEPVAPAPPAAEWSATYAEWPAPPAPSARHALVSLAFLAWAAGASFSIIRLLYGSLRLRRLSRRLRPFDVGRYGVDAGAVARAVAAERLPEVCLSPDVRSPLVAGLVRPRVILPEWLPGQSSPRQLREVLVHECAHVVRRDPLVRVLQRVAGLLFWFHPLIHLLNRRLDLAREEVCDNHVLECADAPGYAETLLTVARLCYPVPRLEGYLTMIPRHHSLERRVADLLESHRDTATGVPAGRRLAIAAALGLTLLGVSSVGFGAARARDEKGNTEPPAKKAAEEKPAANADPATSETVAPGKVAGRVVREDDGRPVAGAEVRMLRRGWYTGQRPRLTKTDARGGFAFDAVPRGEYVVLCFHDGLASRSRRYQGDVVTVRRDESTRPVVLKMRPAVSLRVKVLAQPDGKPIAGARVRLTWTDTDRDHFTDAKGEAVVRSLTPETWRLEVSAKDRAAEVRDFSLVSGESVSTEFTLSQGGAVEGHVRDEEGRPLLGVGVNVNRAAEAGPSDYVKTDVEGRFRFDNLHLNEGLHLYADKPGYVPLRKEFHVDEAGGRLARVDIQLTKRPRGGSVAGVVTDSAGRPVAGAEVVNQGNGTADVRRSKTDAQGKFRIDDVVANSVGHDLVVRAKTFAPRRVEFQPGTVDRPAEVSVRLEPGHRIRGRLLNMAGKPIAKAMVYFDRGNQLPGGELGGSTTTDSEGRFSFDSLPARTPFRFIATDYSEIKDLQLPLDGAEEVVVRMPSAGVVKGRVVDAATGKPVRRFNVRVTFSPERRPNDPDISLPWNLTSTGEDFTSADGRFILNGFMSGAALQLNISADGYRRQAVRRAEAVSGPEAEELKVELKAEDPAKLRTVSGKVVNPKGEPLRGVELRLIVATDRPAARDGYPFNWQMIETGQVEHAPNVLQVQRRTTGADGGFEFRRVAGDAEVELVYWGKGIPGNRMDHLETLSEKERTALVVKTLAPARVVGTIDRKAFPKFSSIELSGVGRFFHAVVSADGKNFTVGDLPPGNYELQVYSPYERVKEHPGSLSCTVLAAKSLKLADGREERVSVGEGDRRTAPTPAPPPQ